MHACVQQFDCMYMYVVAHELHGKLNYVTHVDRLNRLSICELAKWMKTTDCKQFLCCYFWFLNVTMHALEYKNMCRLRLSMWAVAQLESEMYTCGCAKQYIK